MVSLFQLRAQRDAHRLAPHCAYLNYHVNYPVLYTPLKTYHTLFPYSRTIFAATVGTTSGT